MKGEHIVALILAGGEGRRAGAAVPKQFVEVGGCSILCHTLRAFERHSAVTDIIVVCASSWAASVEEEMGRQGITKLRAVAPGGACSTQSLFSGLNAIGTLGITEAAVMVHDAVRPLVSQEILTANLEVYRREGSAVSCIQSQEAYLQSGDGQAATGLIGREALYRAQTPMTFTYERLRRVAECAQASGIAESQSLITLLFEVTPHEHIAIAPSSRMNFKVTFPEDLIMLRKVMHSEP